MPALASAMASLPSAGEPELGEDRCVGRSRTGTGIVAQPKIEQRRSMVNGGEPRRSQEVVGSHSLAAMDRAWAPLVQGNQPPPPEGRVLRIFRIGADQSDRHFRALGIEISADANQAARILIEQAIEKEPCLQRLSDALEGGAKESLRPWSDGAPPGPGPAVRHVRRYGCAQMQVEHPQEALQADLEPGVEHRPVPGDRVTGGAAGQGGHSDFAHELMADLASLPDRVAAQDREIMNGSRCTLLVLGPGPMKAFIRGSLDEPIERPQRALGADCLRLNF